jgi:hypothetical protein
LLSYFPFLVGLDGAALRNVLSRAGCSSCQEEQDVYAFSWTQEYQAEIPSTVYVLNVVPPYEPVSVRVSIVAI